MKSETKVSKIIQLDNEELELNYSNQYAKVVEVSHGRYEVLDVFTLFGDKYQVSAMEAYNSSKMFKTQIDNRVMYVIGEDDDRRQETHRELFGADESESDYTLDNQNSIPVVNVYEALSNIVNPANL